MPVGFFCSLTIDNILNIIVLLILAGVSISMIAGDNSILQKATDAKQATETASAKEQIQIEVLGSYKTSDLELDKEKLKTNLEKIGATVTGNDFPLTVTLNENVFTIKDDGTVENGEVVVKTAKFVDDFVSVIHGFGYSTVTKIERATNEPDEQYKQASNLVSVENSEYPIYMWNENNILNWYSEAEHPELPENISGIFGSFAALTDASGIIDWNTENVTNMQSMFGGCKNLQILDLSNWNTSNVINMRNIFGGCKKLSTLNISNWNTSNVTDMSTLFAQCYDLTCIDLSGWDTSNVINMNNMFGEMKQEPQPVVYYKLQKIIVSSNFKTGSVTSSNGMFNFCVNLVGGNGTTFDSSKTDKSMAHVDTAENPGYFSAN